MIVFKYDNCLIPKNKIFSTAKKLKTEIKKLENYECLNLDDKTLHVTEAAITLKKRLQPKLIVVAGIGGSNLGTKAVQEATGQAPILYADTTDPDALHYIIEEMQNVLRQGQQIILNVISKSGTTTETIANFEVLLNVLKRHRKDAQKYVVATTDKNSKLWQLAVKNNYSVLEIPKNTGGRYSVFTPVGLFPLGMLGIDLKELLKGAEEMKQDCLTLKNNPAAIGASIIYLQKANIYDNFYFSTKLESLGKWHRQLFAESTGKTKKAKTPTVSIGSTDLHSIAQLYLGGPQDKFTNFITTHFKNTIKVPYYPEYNELVPELQKKEINQIMKAIYKGVKKAYKKAKKPYTETHLDGSERSIGAYMQLKMMETILLAKLMKVNPFDQPAVELYKKETKKYL